MSEFLVKQYIFTLILIKNGCKVSLLFRDEYTKFVSLSNKKLPGETGQPDMFDEKG